MFTTIINDCRDENAIARQCTRAHTLLKFPSTLIGVTHEIEAAGMLIDTLDASLGESGVVLVNVAPRHHSKNTWENGTPFGYFFVGKTLVCSSIAGDVLRLVHKLGLAQNIFVFDIPTTLTWAAKNNLLAPELIESISNTQFRSFEFLPRVASWILAGHSVPATPMNLQETYLEHNEHQIWWIDCFGNCKTTLTITDTPTISTPWGTFPLIPRLTDVPDDTIACVIGSSGINNTRFIEIVKQGGSAATELGIHVGDKL